MTCERATELIDQYGGETSVPPLVRIRLAFHRAHCRTCAEEAVRMERVYRFLRTDYISEAPDLRSAIMDKINIPGEAENPVGEPVSLRNWVLVGMIVFFSLLLSSVGLEFSAPGILLRSNLLLPITLTLGFGVTIYGGVFIASHMDDFSERFGLGPREL